MKRIAFICCILISALLLCSCGSANPKKEYLGQDEYSIYQDEEFVSTYLNANMGRWGDQCRFDHVSSLFDISIENLNTKRGIHIGSTLEDIAVAYEGVYFSCYKQKLYDPIETLVQSVDTSESCYIDTETTFGMSEYIQDKGTPVEDEDEAFELMALGKGVKARLTFEVENGVVTDIILFANGGK